MKENILNALNAKIKSRLNDNTIEKLEQKQKKLTNS